ncbi:MAG: hypothetical protein KBC73_05490 [Burkholderiaceae bacterium]|nr:hypothetical protein [Burkholderiaceae bacterium]
MSGAAGKRANIEAYIGASGSGKGVSINRRLAELAPTRLIVWDPRNEYGKWAPGYDSLPHLIGAVRHAKGGPVRARYVFGERLPIEDAFAKVCELAFNAENIVFLAEELSDVTRPSWAPPAWRKCITQGRHQGLHILGAAQRPALIDKTFLANCTRVRCMALGYAEDRRTMARELDCSMDRVEGITARDGEDGGRSWADLQFLERDRRTRELRAGVLRIRGNRITEQAAAT